MLILIFKSVITLSYVEFIKLFALISFLGSCICFVTKRLIQVLKQYFIIRGDDEVLVLNTQQFTFVIHI